jgi:putative ABC transport system permease protein
MKFFLLIAKNIGRNPVRSVLTALGTMVLVFVVTLVWSILWMLDMVTAERSQNFKAIVTERWSIPSRMPFSYAEKLMEGGAREPDDIRPLDAMTWQFYVGAQDPAKMTRDSMLFLLGCDPSKLLTMMDGLDSLGPAEQTELEQAAEKMKANKQGVILGFSQLKATNKRIGERIQLQGISNFKGLDFEFEIVGVMPPGRYDTLGAMNASYFNDQIDSFEKQTGRKHPLANGSLNLVWLKLPNSESFNRVAAQIESSPEFASPAVKCETASSGIASFLEAFRDLIWGMRWLLAPACLATLSLIMANAISISVRERRLEFAVLKVLGFRPIQILFLVLGESLLLGVVAGAASSGLTYAYINWWLQGLSFPMGFLDRFLIPDVALGWGPALGAATALAGSIVPALSARNVKVADVFAQVT